MVLLPADRRARNRGAGGRAATLLPPLPAVACATVLAVAAVIGWWAAVSRLGRIRRTSLTSGADLLAAGSAGLSFLDVGFLVSALETRAYRRRGAVRPRVRAGRSFGPVRALVWSDLVRHRRNTMLPAVLVTGIGGRPHVSVCVRPDVSVSGRFMMPVPPLV